MLNYALNINDSKRFVKYYQEEKDKLIIHYGDNSTMMVENNETIKDNLEEVQRQQILRYNKRIPSIFDTFHKCSKRFFKICGFQLLTMLGLAIIFPFDKADEIWEIMRLGFQGIHVLNFTPVVKNIILKRDMTKHALFLNYRKELSQELQDKEEEIVDVNTNNPVAKPKKVNNLRINDIHFISCFKVKNTIRRIKALEEYNQTMFERCQDIGVAPKQLIKNKK